MKFMATMRDVAKRAAVSTATVSHVVNGTRSVSPELTKRVQAVMAELNYQPDAVARSLRRRKTLTIGLIVPSTEIPFFAAVAHSIEQAALQAGYSVILCNSHWQLPQELHYLDNLLARRVDGLVCISAEMTANQIAPVIEEGTPVVFFERSMPGIALDSVGIDNLAGAQMAVQHLLELGHRRIALITGLRSSGLSNERLNGCRQILAAAGVPLDPALLHWGDYLPESGRRACEELLQLDEPPTAIFAFNDLMAIGALQALHEHGLRVPDDVAVVGFDGIPLTNHTSPALTTVAQPITRLGATTIELLLKRMGDDEPSKARNVIAEPELVIRASTVKASQEIPVDPAGRLPVMGSVL
jgi:LacI family transcriptional regulator